jgi:hypothetical protein
MASCALSEDAGEVGSCAPLDEKAASSDRQITTTDVTFKTRVFMG